MARVGELAFTFAVEGEEEDDEGDEEGAADDTACRGTDVGAEEV